MLTIKVLAELSVFKILILKKNTLYEWNLLGDEIKDALSITEFKRKVLAIIKPLGKSSYGIHDITGVKF